MRLLFLRLCNLYFVAASAQNRPKYFAGLIHDAMDGIGTEDEDLIRLIVTRFEVCS